MDSSTELVTFVNTRIIPLALFVIMLGMGLTLVVNDFKRIFKFPKAVTIGLVNQLVILPIFGFILAISMPLAPELAVGIMLLVVCPGGTTSNLFTHIGKGDVALSVTLTAIASVITVFTAPFIVSYSLKYLMGEGSEFVLPVGKTMGILIFLTIIPVGLGMIIRRFAPHFSDRVQPMVKIFGIAFLFGLVVFLCYQQRDIIVEAFLVTGPVSLLLNVSTMALGYYSARRLQLNNAQSISITLEVGLQNSGLAMTMALGILQNYQMSIVPAIYTLIMFFTAGTLVSYLNAKWNTKVSAEK